MATGTEMLMTAAINTIAKLAGFTPEQLKEMLTGAAHMLHSLGKRAEGMDQKLDNITTRIVTVQSTLDKMNGQTVVLEDDELLLKFPPKPDELVLDKEAFLKG